MRLFRVVIALRVRRYALWDIPAAVRSTGPCGSSRAAAEREKSATMFHKLRSRPFDVPLPLEGGSLLLLVVHTWAGVTYLEHTCRG